MQRCGKSTGNDLLTLVHVKLFRFNVCFWRVELHNIFFCFKWCIIYKNCNHFAFENLFQKNSSETFQHHDSVNKLLVLNFGIWNLKRVEKYNLGVPCLLYLVFKITPRGNHTPDYY